MAEKRLALATLLALSVSLMVVLTALAGPSQSNGFPVASELSQRQLWDDSKHIDLYSAKVSDAPTFDRYYKVDDREPRSIAQAQITVAPQTLPVTLVRGSTTTETLTIDNLGDADLNWNMAENPLRPWLREAPTSGAVTPGGSSAVVVTFATPSLAGVYTTTLRITSDDPDTPQVNVPVTLTVLAPQIEVTPSEIAVALGRSTVATDTLTISNTGDAILNWNLAEAPPAPWLVEAPTNGAVPPGGDGGVVLTFTAPSAVGVYTTNLRINNNDPDEPQVYVPVTLTVHSRVYLPLLMRNYSGS